MFVFSSPFSGTVGSHWFVSEDEQGPRRITFNPCTLLARQSLVPLRTPSLPRSSVFEGIGRIFKESQVCDEKKVVIKLGCSFFYDLVTSGNGVWMIVIAKKLCFPEF